MRPIVTFPKVYGRNWGCSAPILLARLRSSHNSFGLAPYFCPGVFGGSALGLTGFTRDMMTLSMLPGICTRSVVAVIFFLRPLPQGRFPFAACCPLYLPLFTTCVRWPGTTRSSTSGAPCSCSLTRNGLALQVSR